MKQYVARCTLISHNMYGGTENNHAQNIQLIHCQSSDVLIKLSALDQTVTI
jgi:hypothetical protein